MDEQEMVPNAEEQKNGQSLVERRLKKNNERLARSFQEVNLISFHTLRFGQEYKQNLGVTSQPDIRKSSSRRVRIVQETTVNVIHLTESKERISAEDSAIDLSSLDSKESAGNSSTTSDDSVEGMK